MSDFVHDPEPQVQIISTPEGNKVIETTNSDLHHDEEVVDEKALASAIEDANKALAKADAAKAKDEAKAAAEQAALDIKAAEAQVAHIDEGNASIVNEGATVQKTEGFTEVDENKRQEA